MKAADPLETALKPRLECPIPKVEFGEKLVERPAPRKAERKTYSNYAGAGVARTGDVGNAKAARDDDKQTPQCGAAAEEGQGEETTTAMPGQAHLKSDL